MAAVRRLDHVAIAVRDTQAAVAELEQRLGLQVGSSEEVAALSLRLTYLDAGNCWIQLVQPLSETSEISRWLNEHGEGIHHICFGVDSVPEAIAAISGGPPPQRLGSGRGRVSGFVTETVCGVRLECTEFSHALDVDGTPGCLVS